MSDEHSEKSAVSCALSAVKLDKEFPSNVFVEKWKEFLFFEPHSMFDSCFIEVKDLLLREDNSAVIALVNLGSEGLSDHVDSPAIFLTKDTKWMEYLSLLKGDGTAMNWMFLMDRYVSASDRGSWSIYCEKENDIAVFAFNETISKKTSSQIAEILRAKSIDLADSSEDGDAFDFNKLVPNWRSALIAQYGGGPAPKS